MSLVGCCVIESSMSPVKVLIWLIRDQYLFSLTWLLIQRPSTSLRVRITHFTAQIRSLKLLDPAMSLLICCIRTYLSLSCWPVLKYLSHNAMPSDNITGIASGDQGFFAFVIELGFVHSASLFIFTCAPNISLTNPSYQLCKKKGIHLPWQTHVIGSHPRRMNICQLRI